MDSELDSIVHLVTGSLVLFSSIGLFALTLNARYTHAIGRVRELYDDLQKSHEASQTCQRTQRHGVSMPIT